MKAAAVTVELPSPTDIPSTTEVPSTESPTVTSAVQYSRMRESWHLSMSVATCSLPLLNQPLEV